MCKVIAVSSSGFFANYIFAVISHLRASFPAVLLLSVRLMAGHIKENFILFYNGRRLPHRLPGSRTFRPFSRNPLRHRQPLIEPG